MIGGWLYVHFFVKNLSLDINAVNTVVLLLGLLLHRTVFRFTKALKEAVALCWPIVLLYHVYAGVAGLIQFTPVGDFVVTLFDPILTAYTFPVLTVVTSTVVSLLHPDERRPVAHPGARHGRRWPISWASPHSEGSWR